MNKPTTEAGKRLLAEKGAYTYGPLPSEIAAIEAEARDKYAEAMAVGEAVIRREARAAVLRELREEVNHLHYSDPDDPAPFENPPFADGYHAALDEALAAIDRRLGE